VKGGDNVIKKILVPVDGSKQAEKALDYALDLAESSNASVTLLHAMPPLEYPTMPYQSEYSPVSVGAGGREPIWTESFSGKVETDCEQMLKATLERAKSIKPKLDIATKLVRGRPDDVIINTARGENFDLIVIGSHGRGGARAALLGSVSHSVVNNCHCPVTVVR
jgi:nucleotide-binding universal stress UspA family protein